MRQIDPMEFWVLGWTHRLREVKAGEPASTYTEALTQVGLIFEKYLESFLRKDEFPNALDAGETLKGVVETFRSEPAVIINEAMQKLLEAYLANFESALSLDSRA
jgi:hypothetical protein